MLNVPGYTYSVKVSKPLSNSLTISRVPLTINGIDNPIVARYNIILFS